MEVRVKKEECTRCSEFQKHFVKANDKCAQLELDISKKNSTIELLLESTLHVVEVDKLQLEDEIKVLKQKNYDLEKSLRNSKEEEEGKFTQLQTENSVLECEKKIAESEVEAWKTKCKELELRVLELQKEVPLEKMKKGIDLSELDSATEDKDGSAGTPRSITHLMHSADSELGHKRELKSRARKHIEFSSEGNPCKNISRTTPGVKPPVDSIDISDSDDNLNLSKTKKRRVINRVTSDSESESDDNVPIRFLKRKNPPALNLDTNPSSSLNDSSSDEYLKKSTRKRRLNKPGKKSREISKFMNEIDDDNEMEEDNLETESLDGFIVHSSDVSKHDSASDSDEISENDGKSSGESQTESENGMGYGEIMSSLRREKNKEKLDWEYEADMLAEFGKSFEPCMTAVCALYRQQIEKEKSYVDDYMPVIKGHGFNKYDAGSGMELAEFLTDGHPDGDVKKSVEELKEFNPNGTGLCRKYAKRYSKQLFEIYKNEEDPYFRP